MKKLIGLAVGLLLGTIGVSVTARADVPTSELKRIENSKQVLHELMQTPDKGVPQDLLESAKCIAIIPGQKKAAFVVGAQYGRGVAMCRNERGWSGPVFLRLAGGSFGLQAGGQSTDVVLVFRNREGMDKLLSDKFKIGVDATAAAGPIGRDAAAATDLQMHAEILTYSRSRGIFAGISLDGAVVTPDRDADEALYGRGVNRDAVLEGKVAVPRPAESLVAEVRHYTEPQKSARKSG
jgi:SH3 domain-containing YSC84-like protein 1